MALWIRVVNETAVTQSVTPKDGKRFRLTELQTFVGGFIEAVYLHNGTVMFVNEEGKLKGLPYNPVADHIAHRSSDIAGWDQIVGDVVVLTEAEAQADEEDDEELDED